VSGIPAVQTAAEYWETRAIRFGAVDGGLAAVCSYGMPRLYNAAIDLCQRRALRPHLRAWRGLAVLDVGCGIGRWSIPLAARNRVCGIDLSPTMIDIARRRARESRVTARFEVGDVVSLDLREQFDRVLGVTVLQHVMSDADLDRALQSLARHLRPGGQLALLEVAPTEPTARCGSAVFNPRPLARYVGSLERAELRLVAVIGVDLAAARTRLLPSLPLLPRAAGRALLTATSLVSLPIDLLMSRRLSRWSWHKLLIAERGAPR
jgi:SAM-dependent methyltransferase